MDSITQAVLGAAMGEAVLGKKMGNKALFIGAIAGTIPDLDVISKLFLEHDIYGLVYHRGISHSIFFTLFFAPIFGGAMHLYYKSKWNQSTALQSIFSIFWGGFYGLILVILGFLVFQITNVVTISLLAIFLALLPSTVKQLKHNVDHANKTSYQSNWGSWSLMFFLAFLTHWIIDACTAYGTQIFEPFSNYRISFNNISIIDPLYTVPFILGIIAISFSKQIFYRRLWNFSAIGLSTAYLIFSLYAKNIAEQVIQQNIEEQGIICKQHISNPTIANTLLWQTVIETEDAYLYGMYSILDEDKKINFVQLEKNHDLLLPYEDHEYVQILKWFANGYYNVHQREDGSLQFNNLRFGVLNENKDKPIFTYAIGQREGAFDVWQIQDDMEGKNLEEILNEAGTMFSLLWKRIKGIKSS